MEEAEFYPSLERMVGLKRKQASPGLPRQDQGLALGPHLVDLTGAVASGPQANHAEGSREAQRTEEDVSVTVTFAYLLEKIETKFGVCCNERLHCETDDT